MRAHLFLSIIFLITASGCQEPADKPKIKRDRQTVEPKAVNSVKPGCYADLQVKYLYPNAPPEDVKFDKSAAKLALDKLGYNWVGFGAHKYPDNVVLLVTISTDFKKASYSYRQWIERDYPAVFPVDGDSVVMPEYDLLLGARTLEDAIEFGIQSLKRCQDLP